MITWKLSRFLEFMTQNCWLLPARVETRSISCKKEKPPGSSPGQPSRAARPVLLQSVLGLPAEWPGQVVLTSWTQSRVCLRAAGCGDKCPTPAPNTGPDPAVTEQEGRWAGGKDSWSLFILSGHVCCSGWVPAQLEGKSLLYVESPFRSRKIIFHQTHDSNGLLKSHAGKTGQQCLRKETQTLASDTPSSRPTSAAYSLCDFSKWVCVLEFIFLIYMMGITVPNSLGRCENACLLGTSHVLGNANRAGLVNYWGRFWRQGAF